MPEYDEKEVFKKLDELVADCGTQAEAAKRLGISEQYIGDLVRRKTNMTETIAAKLGFTKKIVYEGA